LARRRCSRASSHRLQLVATRPRKLHERLPCERSEALAPVVALPVSWTSVSANSFTAAVPLPLRIGTTAFGHSRPEHQRGGERNREVAADDDRGGRLKLGRASSLITAAGAVVYCQSTFRFRKLRGEVPPRIAVSQFCANARAA